MSFGSIVAQSDFNRLLSTHERGTRREGELAAKDARLVIFEKQYVHRQELEAQTSETNALQRQLTAAQAALRAAEAARGEALRHLAVILPMAKDYAAAHPVGNNQQMCDAALDLARRHAEGVGS